MTSRIVSVESFVASYPVTGSFRFLGSSPGGAMTRDTVLVKIQNDAGNIGWGQSVPSPRWSYETIDTVRTTIDRHLGPALTGLDPFDTSKIESVLHRTIAPSFSTGQPICKAGIDLALFDLTGRALKISAAARWNRTGRKSIALSWTIEAHTLEEVEQAITEGTARGYRSFNVKVGTNAIFDVRMCALLRQLVPESFVWVDANGRYDLETALTVAPALADLGIRALEQPLPANCLPGYRDLRKQGALPILMDEPIVSLTDLKSFHELGLLDGVAMKVPRCGGLTEARRILDYMEQQGLLFFASGLTDPDLSFAAALLLFGAYDLKYPAALNGPQFLNTSFLTRPLKVIGDQAEVPTGTGLGVLVDEARLGADPVDGRSSNC